MNDTNTTSARDSLNTALDALALRFLRIAGAYDAPTLAVCAARLTVSTDYTARRDIAVALAALDSIELPKVDTNDREKTERGAIKAEAARVGAMASRFRASIGETGPDALDSGDTTDMQDVEG